MPNILKLQDALLDILFPPICLNCKKSLLADEKQNGLCFDCFSKIRIHTALFCGACRARLPENKKICHKDARYLLAAATNYDEIARNLIHHLKYRSWSRLRLPIQKLLQIYLQNLNFYPLKLNSYSVVPLPLHKNRERRRGFNQAELIGKIIADQLNLPLEKNLLARIKETKPQVDIKDWDQRKNNLSGAFQIRQPELIKNKNIILVDDVYTSGATVSEAAKILKSSGAKKIIALVIAKTN